MIIAMVLIGECPAIGRNALELAGISGIIGVTMTREVMKSGVKLMMITIGTSHKTAGVLMSKHHEAECQSCARTNNNVVMATVVSPGLAPKDDFLFY